MWVRSQDKTKLINCNTFHISSISEYRHVIFSDAKSLGVYSTEEKAIKVLDGIQRQIEMCLEVQENLTPFAKKSGIVFQMPLDEEVD